MLKADSKKSGGAAYQRNNDSTSQASSGQTGQGMLANMEKNKFQIMRDSILKANGGKMSKDQMAAELNKGYDKIKKLSGQKTPSNIQPHGIKNNFTIVSRYPQYQKRSDDITDKIIAGRVWILNKDGKLESVFVKTGLSDGKASEIISNNVKDGEQIVISADSNSDPNSTQQKNPLAGQQQGQGQNRGR
jgi:hypothetical protein